VLKVLYHLAEFGGARISPAAGVAKNVEFFRLSVCLFVCLSGTLLNVRDRSPDFAMKALEYRNYILMPLDRGRFVIVHCVHNTKCRSPKNGKNWVFRQQRATE